MKFEEMIKTAIKMEEEGRDFYKKAGDCTKDRFGKMMYASLAEDEVRHKKLLEAMRANTPPSAMELDIPLPKEKLKSVFAGIGKDVCARVPSTSDDLEAITFAMGKEAESYRMYAEGAKAAPSEAAKSALERMAKEENQHYEILEQTKYFLEQHENWSIWEDGGPIEGG